MYEDTVTQWEVRKSEKQEKEKKLRILNDELKELADRGKVKRAVQQAHQDKFDNRFRTLKREQNDLNKQYHVLLERIKGIHALHKEKPQPLDPKLREEKESELNRLIDREKRLDKALASRSEATDSTDSFQKLNTKLDKLKKTRMVLESEISELKVKTQYRSTSSHKNPLHIECRANDYVIHPSGDIISIQDMEQGEELRQKVMGYDLVAFWIRPEGIAAFRKAYVTAKEIAIAISFEPVQEGESLESVLRSLTDEK